MHDTSALEALRDANPRHVRAFDDAVAALEPRPAAREVPHRRTLRVPAVAALAAVVVVGLITAWPQAATNHTLERAVLASTQAADESGTVSVHITRNGEVWASRTVRWHGEDLSLTNDVALAGRGDMLVVDGMMYAPDDESPGGWMELGPPESIDPGSGTTPDEYIQAIREDVGGDTLRRITEAMDEPTSRETPDGSTVYAGTVRAEVVARETGNKDGQAIRVLPFGYVAHDAASDGASPVAVEITVGPDDTIHEIVARWGGGAEWTYRLTYRDLGATPAPTAPSGARPLGR